MPLIPQQHIVSVIGSGTSDALKNLEVALDNLPLVKVVSMNSHTWDLEVLGKVHQGLKIIAVVEEV